jgi:hypothetical protein
MFPIILGDTLSAMHLPRSLPRAYISELFTHYSATGTTLSRCLAITHSCHTRGCSQLLEKVRADGLAPMRFHGTRLTRLKIKSG